MIIPFKQLPPETLQNLLEEYATRDGTDYGEREVSLDAKVSSLRRQLEDKTIVIWFEPGEESVNLILAEDIPRDISKDGDH
uniref:YheU family protein n=1 Tax=Microbulbifer agarilyticus TaxID=260552 RepID=UPI0002559A76|nr:YheU family protein [Microbulbifer agarilyticus]